ncbi:MAG: hypothetical protein AAFU65_15930, partial [Pseudomonadota bacterium]
QRERAAHALLALDRDGHLDQVRADVPWRGVAVLWFGTALAAAALTALPLCPPRELGAQPDGPSGPPPVPQLMSASVQVDPPAYTGRPARRSDALSIDTVAFATVRWSLVLDGEAERVELVFHDDSALSLSPRGNRRWVSAPFDARDAVYDVVVNGEPLPGVHRIAVRPDRLPEVQLQTALNPLVITSDAEQAPPVSLSIRARDDYGLTAIRAVATLASGRGEQVRFREQATEIVADVDQADMTLDHPVDLAALGMTPGDELYLVIEAVDNAPDGGQAGQSGTLIVRWPGESAGASTVLATTAVPVLPAYFRSQRQIIIDTEALIWARGALPPDTFAARAQSLATDQRALRLRYGQYLGEEAESGIGEGVVPDALADGNLTTADADHDGHAHGPADAVATDAPSTHDHAGHAPPEGSFGASADVGGAAAAMAPFVHDHDRAEQATLFDPDTTRTLKRALAAMWDAELALRLA